MAIRVTIQRPTMKHRFKNITLTIFASVLLVICAFIVISLYYTTNYHIYKEKEAIPIISTVNYSIYNKPSTDFAMEDQTIPKIQRKYEYPFPLYIFLIGFNKCGTRTLFRFFLKNRIPSIHWTYPDHNFNYTLPDIMTNLYLKNESFFSSNLFNQYMFYSDFGVYPGYPTIHNFTIPWYKILLNKYPSVNIKFILNIRNVNHWLKSRYFHGTLDNATLFISNWYNNKSILVEHGHPYGNIQIEAGILQQWKYIWYKYICNLLKYFNNNNSDNLLIFDVEKDSIYKLIYFFNKFNLKLNASLYRQYGRTGSRKDFKERWKTKSQTKKWHHITNNYSPFIYIDDTYYDLYDNEYQRIMDVCWYCNKHNRNTKTVSVNILNIIPTKMFDNNICPFIIRYRNIRPPSIFINGLFEHYFHKISNNKFMFLRKHCLIFDPDYVWKILEI
eukprot:264372_1